MRRRVAITGAGVICACGRNRAEFWNALREGRSGIAPITLADGSGLRFANAAEVHDWDGAQHFDPAKLSLLDRFAQFTLVAAREALSDAALALTPELRERTAVVTGSSMGGQTTEEAGYEGLLRRGARVHPLTIPRSMANAGASHICIEFGITGPGYTISSACSSANHAIGLALRAVQNGEAEAAIAGGGEAPITYTSLRAWEGMRVIAPDTCRPFSKDRRGMILGEGAAMLVLEPLEAAQARGARVYAELAGFGMSSDAHHITQPSADGAAAAMRAALRDAAMAPEQVGYINAHGTGTPVNDPTETRAIRCVFGTHAERLAVSSTKSMHGHALGAAGAIEAVATLLALHESTLPPTANFTEADPECDLDVVPNQARDVSATPVECALSNSFAFGGLNAVLAMRRSAA
ncbi:MAG: beta-ketoacyl-[acyl-carrier-protein] synthase family protein [Candidatus Acidiferrales bacterium]